MTVEVVWLNVEDKEIYHEPPEGPILVLSVGFVSSSYAVTITIEYTSRWGLSVSFSSYS